MKDTILFSIVVVTLNAALEVPQTFTSIANQTYSNYEVIVKDGCSKDSTVNLIPRDSRFRLIEKEDSGIYDAMNQALDEVTGHYIVFLNAGDSFYDENVLLKLNQYIIKNRVNEPCILYGNYSRNGEYIQNQKEKLDDFTLYRRPLCHQSLFYHKDIFSQGRRYNTEYKISADHDITLQLWKDKIPFYHTGITICEYAGGGLSETEKGYNLAVLEKNYIMEAYFSGTKRFFYGMLMSLSLQNIRRWLDSDKSPQALKKMYRRIRNILLH